MSQRLHHNDTLLTTSSTEKKLHISVKLTTTGLSSLVAYGGFESEMGKTKPAILLP